MSNTTGGSSAGARNVISGNLTAGINIQGNSTSNNDVQGNFIGTDVTGTAAVPNILGVEINIGAQGNFIGTNEDGVNDAAEGNLISGNSNDGVQLNSNATGNVVAGNKIGTDV